MKEVLWRSGITFAVYAVLSTLTVLVLSHTIEKPIEINWWIIWFTMIGMGVLLFVSNVLFGHSLIKK